jgi:hypothetical protein
MLRGNVARECGDEVDSMERELRGMVRVDVPVEKMRGGRRWGVCMCRMISVVVN